MADARERRHASAVRLQVQVNLVPPHFPKGQHGKDPRLSLRRWLGVALLLVVGAIGAFSVSACTMSSSSERAGFIWHVEAYLDTERCVDPCPPSMLPDGVTSP